MWNKIRSYKISWWMGVLLGLLLMSIGLYFKSSGSEEASGNGEALYGIGRLTAMVAILFGIGAGIKRIFRRKPKPEEPTLS